MNLKRLKRSPTTPGEILKEEFLLPMGLTQKQLANHIDVDIKVINRLVNDKTSVSPDLALKLASAFNTSPQFWLNAQLAVDLYLAYQELESDLPGEIAS
jgi:addiction module HigA family antidote